ncbi:hypothetical protein EON65_20940 [archaeon]|nr:MAG: hypothetical protein EON65_20940 [archaeon]
MSHGSVHVVRKAGVIDSAFNHQVYDALDDIPDHDSDDEAPETKDQYFEFSDAYGIMRLIRCIIYVQIVALILDNPALRISHMLDICCRGVLYYSIHFYSRPFLDVIYIVQLFGDGIAKFFISQNAPKTPDNVEVTPPGRRLNVNPYTSNGQLVENTPDLTFSLDVVQDQYWHTLQHFAHYFLGLMFVLLAVFFFVRFWEIKDYSERKGVKKWLHTYITDGWFRRGGKKIFFSLVTAVGTLGFFILCIHALTNSMGPDSLSNGLILSSLFAVGISIVAVLWLISVIWIRITEQTFVRYVSQNVAYTSVIILKRAIKAKMDIGLVLLVSLYMPVVYTLFEAQIPLLDWSDTLAESFRKGVNFYVPCYYAAFPPFKQTFLPPSTCPVASYSSPSQELGNSGFYYIQQTLQCDSFLGVCLHVLSTALSIYVILFYFYFFYRVIDQVVGEFRVSRWVDVLHKLIRIREEEVMEYQVR